jgi:putative hydrolase
MSSDDTPESPFSGGNPFEGVPMFAEFAKALAGQGPLNWDAARQFAALAAPPGANVDPSVRIAIEALVPIASLHVSGATGYDGTFPALQVMTSSEWAQRTLEAYRPLFTELATSLGRRPDGTEQPADPMMAMLGQMSKMMSPSLLGMAVGGMVGRLAARAFGLYDLPIPRPDRALVLVPANIDEFTRQWSLGADEMRLWVLGQELTAHVLLSAGTVADDLSALVRQHVGAFRPDPEALAEQLGGLGVDSPDGDPMQALQQAFSDPAVVLGAIQSPEQRELAPRLDAAVAAVLGYVDYMVDSAAVRVIGGDALQIAEAVRRRRLETSTDDVYIDRLLGLRVDPAQVQRGKLFIGGAVDRVGEHSVTDAFRRPQALPTPAELEAPGLWLARLDVA